MSCIARLSSILSIPSLSSGALAKGDIHSKFALPGFSRLRLAAANNTPNRPDPPSPKAPEDK